MKRESIPIEEAGRYRMANGSVMRICEIKDGNCRPATLRTVIGLIFTQRRAEKRESRRIESLNIWEWNDDMHGA